MKTRLLQPSSPIAQRPAGLCYAAKPDSLSSMGLKFFFMAFVVMSALSDMSIGTPVFCHFRLHERLFLTPHFQSVGVLCPKVGLL